MLAFRYYDPRVLNAYLPTCTPQELKAVFGPLQAVIAETGDGQSLRAFEFGGATLHSREVKLE
jgi:hypothetical protein